MWNIRPYKLVGVVKHLTLLFVKSFFFIRIKNTICVKIMISCFLLEKTHIFFIIRNYKGWGEGSVSIFYFSLDLTDSLLTGQSITKGVFGYNLFC